MLKNIINNQINGNFDPNNIIIISASYKPEEEPLDSSNGKVHYYQGSLDYLLSLETITSWESYIKETMQSSDLTDDDLYDTIPEGFDIILQLAWVFHCLGNEEESQRLTNIVKSTLPRLIKEAHEFDTDINTYIELNYALNTSLQAANAINLEYWLKRC